MKDATFHTDIGFYVFQLPFLSFVLGWLFSALVVVLIATLVAHYLNGGIRVQVPGQRVSPQVKAHVSVLLGLLSLVRAGQYWLDRYELVFSTRGTVDGATYTDVNVQVKALYLLMIISITAFVLFLVQHPAAGLGAARDRGRAVAVRDRAGRRGGARAGAAVPGEARRAGEGSALHPPQHRPRPATALGPGRRRRAATSTSTASSTSAASARATPTSIKNMRLWDPAVVQAAFERTQGSGLRDFYSITDVDVDRYTIDGETTQVNVAARDLSRDGIPQTSWVSAAPHLHPRLRRGRVAGQRGDRRRPARPRRCKDVPVDADRRARPRSTSPGSTSARARPAT